MILLQHLPFGQTSFLSHSERYKMFHIRHFFTPSQVQQEHTIPHPAKENKDEDQALDLYG